MWTCRGRGAATRSLLAPDARTPEYVGLYSISGIADGMETEPGISNMTFARNGAFIHLAAPGGEVARNGCTAPP